MAKHNDGKSVMQRKMHDVTGMNPLPHEWNNVHWNQRCVHCSALMKRNILSATCFVRTRLEHAKVNR